MLSAVQQSFNQVREALLVPFDTIAEAVFFCEDILAEDREVASIEIIDQNGEVCQKLYQY